jgi:uncharacterized protein
MRALLSLAVGLCLLGVHSAYCQDAQINRQNRSVDVTVSETVKVAPDFAVVTLGCMTYGETHDEAYQANLKIADQVIQAIQKAGVSKQQIENSTIQLSENPAANFRPDLKGRQFMAHETWQIHLSVSDAQKIIDDAVAAGANGIETVTWDVSDPQALEAKARAVAMKKARETAAQIAESGGAKLGELLYASNLQENTMYGGVAGGVIGSGSEFGVGGGVAVPVFSLKLFPSKVEKEATVRAIFALD